MKNQLTQFAARSRVLLQRLVGLCGFVLVPVREMERIERDARDYAVGQKLRKPGTQEYGYFNGLADYSAKKATELRRYMPNAKSEPRL